MYIYFDAYKCNLMSQNAKLKYSWVDFLRKNINANKMQL